MTALRDAVAPQGFDGLTVQFVIPHYFLSLLQMDGIAGTIYCKEDQGHWGEYGGLILPFRNERDEWLIEVREILDDQLIIRTHIENVERIVVM